MLVVEGNGRVRLPRKADMGSSLNLGGGESSAAAHRSSTISIEQAHARGAAGMNAALANAMQSDPGWSDKAYEFLLDYARRHRTFISEDVSDAARSSTLPRPPTDRAWGGIYQRAARAGMIIQDGIGRSRRRHGSICPRWRSLTWVGKRAANAHQRRMAREAARAEKLRTAGAEAKARSPATPTAAAPAPAAKRPSRSRKAS